MFMRDGRLLAHCLMMSLTLCASGLAQSASRREPKFEVASIKDSKPGAPGASMRWEPNGRLFTARNITARTLILFAYGIRDDQLSRGPKWLDSAAYDIVANAGSVSSGGGQKAVEDNRLRLQALLADRFRLRIHSERQERSAYALTTAKNGPKFASVQSTSGNQEQKNNKGAVMTMALLASLLQSQLGRTVIDKTGLYGSYFVTLKWSSDDGTPKAIGMGPASAAAVTSDNNAPSIFTALQEQLGLRLEDRKLPIEIYIVDHVEPPSGN